MRMARSGVSGTMLVLYALLLGLAFKAARAEGVGSRKLLQQNGPGSDCFALSDVADGSAFLQAVPSADMFLQMLDAMGLGIDQQDSVTVFAPTDDAIIAAIEQYIDGQGVSDWQDKPDDWFSDYLTNFVEDNEDAVMGLIKNHIASGALSTDQLYDGLTVDTEDAGQMLLVQREDDNITLIDLNPTPPVANAASITIGNVPLCNGALHIIDALLIPKGFEEAIGYNDKKRKLLQQADSADEEPTCFSLVIDINIDDGDDGSKLEKELPPVSGFLEWLDLFDLGQEVSRENVTVFAPSNDALWEFLWEQIEAEELIGGNVPSQEEFQNMTDDQQADWLAQFWANHLGALEDLVRFHIVEGSYQASDLTNGLKLETLDTATPTVTSDQLYAPDIACWGNEKQPKTFTCAQQKAFGKCDADWMVSGGLCEQTCGRCAGPETRSNQGEAQTLQVQRVGNEITLVVGNYLDDKANVSIADVELCNGVLHLIDRVLSPPEWSIHAEDPIPSGGNSAAQAGNNNRKLLQQAALAEPSEGGCFTFESNPSEGTPIAEAYPQLSTFQDALQRMGMDKWPEEDATEADADGEVAEADGDESTLAAVWDALVDGIGAATGVYLPQWSSSQPEESQAKGFTVFAPTNTAMNSFIQGLGVRNVAGFLRDDTKVEMLLEYLVEGFAPGRHAASELEGGAVVDVLVENRPLTFEGSDGNLKVKSYGSSGDVIVTDIPICGGGITHIIDVVLNPNFVKPTN